jgi:hypothetical protein
MRKNIIFVCISFAFMQKPVQAPANDTKATEGDAKNYKDLPPLNLSPSFKSKQVLYTLPDSGAIVVSSIKERKSPANTPDKAEDLSSRLSASGTTSKGVNL